MSAVRAWRYYQGRITEIFVDVDQNGNPILPPDSTTTPPPPPSPNHYLIIQGTDWVQVPIVQPNPPTIEDVRRRALSKWKAYRDWYVNQPVTFENKPYDADELSRSRLAQALVAYNEFNILPEGWVATDNSVRSFDKNNPADVQAFKDLAQTVAENFKTRFLEMEAIRQQLLQATTIDDIETIENSIPNLRNAIFPF